MAFNGIQFKYTDNLGFHGYSQTKAPLLFDGCSHVSVTKCRFHHMGYNAIYTQRTKFINVRFQCFVRPELTEQKK